MSLRDDIAYVRKIQLHMNRVGLWEDYRAITAVLEAALRAEQAALQPGQVAVDEADLRKMIRKYPPAPGGCRSDCPLYNRDDKQCSLEGPWCEPKLLKHWGLEVEK